MTGAETAAFLAGYARSFAAPVRSGVDRDAGAARR